MSTPGYCPDYLCWEASCGCGREASRCLTLHFLSIKNNKTFQNSFERSGTHPICNKQLNALCPRAKRLLLISVSQCSKRKNNGCLPDLSKVLIIFIDLKCIVKYLHASFPQVGADLNSGSQAQNGWKPLQLFTDVLRKPV